MTSFDLRALILSPSASHPRDYGNRNRVWQTASFLKRIGYKITFMLYPLESDWQRAIPSAYADMKRAWDEVIVIPPSIALHQRARGEHHQIDEWWDPEIERHLLWLLQRQTFDLLFVNYTFLSKAFDLAPKSTIKVLDTHDIFTGRKEMLAAQGIEPEFFYTTSDQERTAFERADLILAIKDSERELIRKLTGKTVLSVPFYPAEAIDAGTRQTASLIRNNDHSTEKRELVVGFIGAENSVNIFNMRRFLNEMERFLTLYTPPMRIVIAGNVCRGLWSDSPAVRLIGRVPAVKQFYDSIDLVVAPLDFSTGIKIKVGEALAHGKPIVSTKNGFDGYPPFDSFHSLPNITSVCRALIRISYDRDRRALLSERSAMSGRMAALITEGSLSQLGVLVRDRTRRIVFISDVAFWRRDTLWSERIYQWYELLSYLSPIICFCVGDYPNAPDDDLTGFPGRCVPMPHLSYAGASDIWVEAIENIYCTSMPHFVIATSKGLTPTVRSFVKKYSRTTSIDLWTERTSVLAGMTFGALADEVSSPDIIIERERDEPLRLRVAPLRYLPDKLTHWRRELPANHFLIVLCSNKMDRLRDDVDFVASTLQSVDKRVTVVGPKQVDGIHVCDTEFLAWAKSAPSVEGMLLVGDDVRMRRLYRATAGYLGIYCEEIGSDRFPLLHTGKEGDVGLVHSLPELLHRLVSSGTRPTTPDTHDGGWSILWKTLEAA